MEELSRGIPEDRGHDGWYHVARKAASPGKQEEAFKALRRACSHWISPPLWNVKVWESDTRWGRLREHPEFKQTLQEKRDRIGPIHALLMYSPGWWTGKGNLSELRQMPRFHRGNIQFADMDDASREASKQSLSYSFRSRTTMKASWGMSTVPMRFMRFLPAFWFSSSFRFRVTSPP